MIRKLDPERLMCHKDKPTKIRRPQRSVWKNENGVRGFCHGIGRVTGNDNIFLVGAINIDNTATIWLFQQLFGYFKEIQFKAEEVYFKLLSGF